VNPIVFIVLIAVMWAVLIVPQQRKMRRQRELVSSLTVGDDVMLSSGIYGTITDEDDDDLFVTIAEGVEIRVARGAVSNKVEYEDETSKGTVEYEDETSKGTVEYEDETSKDAGELAGPSDDEDETSA
jgi:preprotein translocase subunit YajC